MQETYCSSLHRRLRRTEAVGQPSAGHAAARHCGNQPFFLHAGAALPLNTHRMDRLPGFRDFYPEPVPHADSWSADHRSYVFQQWRETARRYGFREYDGPPLEPLELYTLKSGEEIVHQLYHFIDKGDRHVALRPEMTPTLARMVAVAERHYKKPIKWFAVPQLFRYERQQKGRLREHFQFNADIIGEPTAAADAELIALLIDTLRGFGLTEHDFVIRLSSRAAWHDFYQQKKGDPHKAYEFFQAVDKMERSKPEETATRFAPLGIGVNEVRDFIASGKPTPDLDPVLESLRARGLDSFVQVDFGVIRGLAYYTGVVFEAFDRKNEFRALAGGGRYDNLVGLVSQGKVQLPALGFGMGDVVLLELLQSRNLLPTQLHRPAFFVLIGDESLRGESLRFIQELRESGHAVEYSLNPLKPDKQFKRALELEAVSTLRLETGESGHLQVRMRNLNTREEIVLPREEVMARLPRAFRP